ncbi:MAG: hypothetical protein DRR16_13420 [Candidatus Parabeggiatoa sp. nov. 3]|jgi:hypothetical protein|nr:MAG: hypothetical protein DRR00_19320 [Gammaproteobacteria bacterium]RKZ60402.1 MAG: hypothetical protein DRQ99_22115 [Gammaproteobacteria bacterium]RKZ84887.1 MAG: hypothetical protein DRR16_13420 [Gammaproteobacteria bacterium]
MEIKTDDYAVTYDPETAIVVCKGSLLLSSAEEYAPILDLLTTAADEQSTKLTVDVKELEFLNSSGINTFTKFVVKVRKKQTLQLEAVGYGSIPWQVRLLKNLQRLLPTLALKLE